MTGPADYTESFKRALLIPERRPLARISYCNLNWVPQEVITGEVTPDSTFSLSEQGNTHVDLRLWNPYGSRTPDPTSDSWYGRFLVEYGLLTDAGQEFVDLGRFVATQAGAQVTPPAGWAILGLDDPSALWGTFSLTWVISANDKIVDVLRLIALDAGESADNLVLYNTDENVGADMTFQPGQSRWEAFRRIASAAQDVGLVLNAAYRVGRCTLYPEVDPATSAPLYRFATGDGITTSLDKRWESQDFANHIIVYGGSGSSATIMSEIADTSAGPYGSQRRGDVCFKWPQSQELDPLITTQKRADARRDFLYQPNGRARRLSSTRGWSFLAWPWAM
jgi:hypothetical protein